MLQSPISVFVIPKRTRSTLASSIEVSIVDLLDRLDERRRRGRHAEQQRVGGALHQRSTSGIAMRRPGDLERRRAAASRLTSQMRQNCSGSPK